MGWTTYKELTINVNSSNELINIYISSFIYHGRVSLWVGGHSHASAQSQNSKELLPVE